MSSAGNSGAGSTVISLGLPSVSVPVLSTTSVSAFSRISRASAFLMRTPFSAPLPVPTMMAIGVANPRAHGQAMMSTATALTSACANGASFANTDQRTKVEDADRQHGRHEIAGNLVDEPLNRRPAALGFADHADDVGQQRVPSRRARPA